MHSSKRAPAAILCTLLFVLAACGGTPAPTQTPFIIVVTAGPGSGVSVGLGSPTAEAPTSAPTRAPTNTSAPTPAGATPASTEVNLSTYSGSNAPFSLQYPSDWTVLDQEQSQKRVTFTSRDQLAGLLVSYGSAGTQTTEEALQSFLNNYKVAALKTSNQRKNVDGSIRLDLQYNGSSGSPMLGALRIVRQSTSANFYVIIFSATPELFAQLRALNLSLLNSFQERTPIVRATPTLIARAPSTSTPEPATDTPAPNDTPVPTDTPVPPPTNTPRPAVALFRLDVQARGYENWGAPKEGCQSFASGQWDNNHTIKRLTLDVTLNNNSNQTIRPEDVTIGMSNNAGTALVWCIFTPVPSTPPHGSATYVFTTFVELNQFLSEMRLAWGNSTVHVCFGRNNPPSVVGCG